MMGMVIIFYIVDLGCEVGVEVVCFVCIMVLVLFFSILIGFLMGYFVDCIRVLYIVWVLFLG